MKKTEITGSRDEGGSELDEETTETKRCDKARGEEEDREDAEDEEEFLSKEEER